MHLSVILPSILIGLCTLNIAFADSDSSACECRCNYPFRKSTSKATYLGKILNNQMGCTDEQCTTACGSKYFFCRLFAGKIQASCLSTNMKDTTRLLDFTVGADNTTTSTASTSTEATNTTTSTAASTNTEATNTTTTTAASNTTSTTASMSTEATNTTTTTAASNTTSTTASMSTEAMNTTLTTVVSTSAGADNSTLPGSTGNINKPLWQFLHLFPFLGFTLRIFM